jgi:diguanylate cyclase (GGDEF)-like protein
LLLVFSSLYGVDLELKNQSKIELIDYFDTYITNNQETTLQEIESKNLWQKNRQITKRVGYSRVEFWAKVEIKNLSNKKRYYLINRYPHIEKIDIYIKDNDRYIKKYKSGSSRAYNQRYIEEKAYIFPIYIEKGETKSIYINASHYGSLPIDFKLYDDIESINYISTYSMVQAILIGALAMILIYHITLYAITQNRHYKDYLLIILSALIYELSIKGYLDAYLYPESIVDIDKYIILPFGIIIAIAIINFIKNILNIDIEYPRLNNLLKYNIYILSALVLANLLATVFVYKSDTYFLIIRIMQYAIVATIPSLLGTIWYIGYKQDNFIARLIAIITIPHIVCSVIFILVLQGFIPYFEHDMDMFEVSQVLYILFISSIIAYKIKSVESENNYLQEETESLKKKLVSKVNEIKENTLIDNLTKLHNREALSEELIKSDQKSIILIDIDRFKEINELYSIESGNMVLLKMAKILKKIAFENSLDIYRVSADQFILLDISHKSKSELNEIIKETIENTKKSRFSIENGVELSIDITMCCVHNRIHVLEEAIIGLNYAKTEHKQIVYYDDSIDIKEHLKHKNEILNEIKIAVENDNFLPFFQPIYDNNKNIIKYEALMRLKIEDHDGIRYLTPYHFLDVAIKSKYYETISLSVIKKSLSMFANKEELISVNLSYQDIKNKHFIDMFLDVLESSGISHRVVVEIIESEDITNIEMAMLFIERLRALNVKIALDDFGSGYSNFINILRLSPDYIKIDGSLIKHIDTDKGNEELVKAVVQFCKKLNIKTVAEFVHSEEIYKKTQELGIDEYQGFYLSEPIKNI